MKADPEDTDTRMSDAGDENSFARANQGDSPDWTTRPMHIIQATPHAEDSATHDISNNSPEEGEYPPAQPDEAVSSAPSLFPATTADGTVFYMQDTSQAARPANSGGPSRSDVSMAVQSQDDAPPDLVEMSGRSSAPRVSDTASNYCMGAPPGLRDPFASVDTTIGLSSCSAEANAMLAHMQALPQAEAMVSGYAGNYQFIGGSLETSKEDYDLAPPLSDDDGYRSDIEEFQDISDDDMPKRDLFGADTSSGYERAA